VNQASSEEARFSGLKVLLVEDETLISFLVEDMLQELGCTAVWHASGLSQARSIVAERRPDVAVLDVNLGGQLVYPLVAELEAEGIPLLFATGYGRTGLPETLTRHPVVQKPFALEALAAAIASVLRTDLPRSGKISA
jgi:DNA-binding response OmpR family regulator